MEAMKMTKWQAQMIDTSKFTGGTGGAYDVNVSVVPVKMIRSFAISDTTNPAVSLFLLDGRERWYKNGRDYTPSFPERFALADSSVLTIERNSPAEGDLVFSQKKEVER